MLACIAGCRVRPVTPDQAINYLQRSTRSHLSTDKLRTSIDIVVAAKDMRARPVLSSIIIDRKLDPHVRINAALALGMLRDEDALLSLARAVEDESIDYNLRGAAAKSLCRYEDGRVIPILLRALARNLPGSSSFYDLFTKRKDKADAVPGLIDILDLERRFDITAQGIGETAARALGEIGDTKATAPLMKAIEGNNQYTKSAAIHALAKIGDARCVPLLMHLVQEKGQLFAAAIEALGKIGDVSAVPLLFKIVDSKNDHWHDAVVALGEIGDTRAEPCLLKRLNDNDLPDGYYARILHALGNICSKDSDISRIRSFCHSPNSNLRKVAVTALGNIGNFAAVDDVVPLLDDEDYHVRESAIKAISFLPSPRAIQGIANSLILNKSKGLKKEKFDSLVTLCANDLEPIVQLLERTNYASGLEIDVLAVFTKRQDPRYIKPFAKCFLVSGYMLAAGIETKLEHSEAGRLLVKMAADYPDALKDTDDEILKDFWPWIVSWARDGDSRVPFIIHKSKKK
jgi:HEAT repeat protein